MEYRFEDILEIRNGKNQKAVENPEGRYPIYGSGVIWIVDGSNDFYFKDGNLIRVDASEKFDSVYMKNLLENLIDDYKKQMSTGTTYNALTISGLTKLKVYDVPIELQNLFSEFVNQVYKSKVVA